MKFQSRQWKQFPAAVAFFLLGLLVARGVGPQSGPEGTRRSLARHLQFAPQLSVSEVGGVVLVEGEAASLGEFERVAELTSALSSAGVVPVRNLVGLDPRAKLAVAQIIEREIGSPEITVRPMGDTLIIEGTAENEFEADRSLEMARVATTFSGPGRPASERENAGAPAAGGSRSSGRWPSQIVDLMRVRPPFTGEPRGL